jgi:hypothetical protein
MATTEYVSEVPSDGSRILSIEVPAGANSSVLSSLQAAMQKTIELVLRGQGDVIADADRIAELVTTVWQADGPLQEERINRLKTVELIYSNSEWFTVEDIHQAFYGRRPAKPKTDPEAKLPPVSALQRKSLPASDWKRRKSVFSVNYKGRELFAAYQFSANLRPLPVIKKVIDAFGPVADTWTLAAWFEFPNSWLAKRVNGRRVARAPKDALDDSEVLVHAATMRLQSYVA